MERTINESDALTTTNFASLINIELPNYTFELPKYTLHFPGKLILLNCADIIISE